jgi:hypothetical protein
MMAKSESLFLEPEIFMTKPELRGSVDTLLLFFVSCKKGPVKPDTIHGNGYTRTFPIWTYDHNNESLEINYFEFANLVDSLPHSLQCNPFAKGRDVVLSLLGNGG